ncbi:MAG: hypothetical protein ACXWMO_11350 [Syntrophales bacterium]
MRNNMQTPEGEVRHTVQAVPMSLTGQEMQQSQRGRRGKKNIRVEIGISKRGNEGHQEKGITHVVYGV